MLKEQYKQSGQKKRQTRMLKKMLIQYKFSWKLTQTVARILAQSGNIDDVACLIREKLNLHTCYINYDMNTEHDTANVAGLSSCFGEWFSQITKTIKGIPFTFTREKDEPWQQPINAAGFIKNLSGPMIIKSDYYRPLVVADNLASLPVNVQDIQSFLMTKLGELMIIPLQQSRGAMLLIQMNQKQFSRYEKKLIASIANTISLNLDRTYYIYHDELGLKNSVFFKTQIVELDNLNADYGVISIRINGLERINEDYSYAQGNILLVEINKRIQNVLTENGYAFAERMVARRSGFVFMVLLPGVKDRQTLQVWLERLKDRLSQYYVIAYKDNLELQHESTMGACLSVETPGGESIIQKVTDALNAAKKNRCTSLIYCQEIEQQKTFQKQVAQIIKQLKDGENSHNSGVPFFLKYQPKVNALTNVITGWEALCRLEIPNLGVVSPNYFIRLAEEENLIWYIDMWVVKEVCRQVKVWGNQGYHLPVSLNLSRYYMNQSDVVDAITAIFSEIDYYEYRHLIQFEITETGVFNQQCLKTISDLNQKLGIKFIIDDVGMQQANLYTLLTLYINGLIESVKIDKIYAAKILQHDEQGKLILDKEGKPYLDNEGCKYIISLLRSFDGLFTLPDQPRPPVLCEGVEYREQVEWLLKNGCHIMQGFYFGKPIPVHECLRFLK